MIPTSRGFNNSEKTLSLMRLISVLINKNDILEIFFVKIVDIY